MNLTRSDYQTLLRRDFYAFTERCFYELNPTTKFLPNWHIEVVVSELEACRRGEITRLIINQPPRSLKSERASVAFPAYLLESPTAINGRFVTTSHDARISLSIVEGDASSRLLRLPHVYEDTMLD